MTFVVDLRGTSTASDYFHYGMWSGATSTATQFYDPTAYAYSLVGSWPEEPKPRLEDDLVALYDDPWELP